MAEVPFLGCRISLISKCDIRYEGILYCVDAKESTIALSKVKSYGTEDRADPNSGSWVAPKNEVYDIIIFRASDVKDLRVDTPEPPGLSDPAIISARQHAYPSGAPTSSTSSATVSKNSAAANAAAAAAAAATMAAAVTGSARLESSSNKHQAETSRNENINHHHRRDENHRNDNSNRRDDSRNRDSRNHDSRRRATSNPRVPRNNNNNNDTRGPNNNVNLKHTGNHNNNNNNNERRYNNHPRRVPNQTDRSYKKHGDGRQPGDGRGPPGERRHYNNDRRQHNDGRPPFRRGPNQGMRRPRSGDRSVGQGYRGPRKSAPLKFDGEYDFEDANQKFLGIVSKLKSLKLKKDEDAKHSDKLPTDKLNSKAPSGDSESGSGYDSEDNTHRNEDSNDETAACEYYDKTKSFFDSISCEASERSQGKVGKPDWRKERQLNAETFGVSANYRRTGGYRPRVWQVTK